MTLFNVFRKEKLIRQRNSDLGSPYKLTTLPNAYLSGLFFQKNKLNIFEQDLYMYMFKVNIWPVLSGKRIAVSGTKREVDIRMRHFHKSRSLCICVDAEYVSPDSYKCRILWNINECIYVKKWVLDCIRIPIFLWLFQGNI